MCIVVIRFYALCQYNNPQTLQCSLSLNHLPVFLSLTVLVLVSQSNRQDVYVFVCIAQFNNYNVRLGTRTIYRI